MPDEPEVIWVGEQRLMEGYCGRAVVASPAAPASDSIEVTSLRCVVQVALKRRQGRVLRIGPPRIGATREVTGGMAVA